MDYDRHLQARINQAVLERQAGLWQKVFDYIQANFGGLDEAIETLKKLQAESQPPQEGQEPAPIEPEAALWDRAKAWALAALIGAAMGISPEQVIASDTYQIKTAIVDMMSQSGDKSSEGTYSDKEGENISNPQYYKGMGSDSSHQVYQDDNGNWHISYESVGEGKTLGKDNSTIKDFAFDQSFSSKEEAEAQLAKYKSGGMKESGISVNKLFSGTSAQDPMAGQQGAFEQFLKDATPGGTNIYKTQDGYTLSVGIADAEEGDEAARMKAKSGVAMVGEFDEKTDQVVEIGSFEFNGKVFNLQAITSKAA